MKEFFFNSAIRIPQSVRPLPQAVLTLTLARVGRMQAQTAIDGTAREWHTTGEPTTKEHKMTRIKRKPFRVSSCGFAEIFSSPVRML